MDSLEKEVLSRGFKAVAGVDEAGRGPLAGPVVASAVVYSPRLSGLGIKDSKKLGAERRESLASLIYMNSPCVAVGVVWPEEIDKINIHKASLLAMERAVKTLATKPAYLIVDGRFTIPGLEMEQQAVVGGDSKSVTAASASIIAKTTRDSVMLAYHSIFPEYNFIKNKGYPTKEHVLALRQRGPTPIHRKTFNFDGK